MAALYSLVLSILFFLILLLLLVLRTKRKNEEKARHRLPPGPPGLPLIGNLHQLPLSNSCIHRTLWQLSRKYGPLMYLQLGRVPALVVSSARTAREFLKTHDLEFASRPPLVAQQKLSYNGLDLAFAPYGDYWREMRKICILELFSIKRVQSFWPIRQDEVARLIKSISQFASSSHKVNLSDMLVSLTNDIICRLAFGKSYQGGGGCESSKFNGYIDEARNLLGSFAFADFFPLMGWIDVLTGHRARLEKNFKNLDSIFQQIIDEHLDSARTEPEHEDITDVLIRLRRDGSFGIDLTWDHIKGVLMDIFVAGTDTSALVVDWAMAELIRNPRVMKKVQDEVRNLVGRKAIVEESDLQQLNYLKSVVKETMRMHPPAPILIQHINMEPCTIDGYEIFAKTRVFVNVWAIGRDPESWENPNEFFPERFMDSAIDFKGQHFKFIPFGAGRRGCPGMSLGAVTVELVLANLLYSFNWELPTGMKKEDVDMDESPGITVHRKNALPLMATNSHG